jgi:hypothetical protein
MWGVLAVLVVANLLVFRSELHLVGPAQDEGLLLVYPSLMLHGAVPNHSFESVYGSASLWAVAGAFRLLGTSVAAERSVALLYWMAITGSVGVLVGRRRGPVLGVFSGALSLYVLVRALGLVAYAWIGALAFAMVGLLIIDTVVRRQRGQALTRAQQGLIAAAGLCFGLAVSYRLDMALAIAMVLVLLLRYWRPQVWTLLVGFGFGLVPIVASCFRAGVVPVLRGQLLEPVFVSGPGRRLPLVDLSPTTTLVLAATCLCAIGLTVAGYRALKQGGGFVLLAIGLFEVGILPQVFQRADPVHLAYVACVVVPMVLLLPVPVLTRRQAAVLGSLGLLILALPLSQRSYADKVAQTLGLRSQPQHVVRNDGRSVPVASTLEQRQLDGLVAAVDRHATAGQRIFVGPDDLRRTNYDDTFLYFLFPHLVPGSFYLEMEPGVANGSNTRLAQELRDDQWLILTSRYDHWTDPNASQAYGSDAANRVIAADFRSVGRWGPWRLMVNTRCPDCKRI